MVPEVKITTRSANPRNIAIFRYNISPYTLNPYPRNAYAKINASCRQIISRTIKSPCFNQPSESFRYIFFFSLPSTFLPFSLGKYSKRRQCQYAQCRKSQPHRLLLALLQANQSRFKIGDLHLVFIYTRQVFILK